MKGFFAMSIFSDMLKTYIHEKDIKVAHWLITVIWNALQFINLLMASEYQCQPN